MVEVWVQEVDYSWYAVAHDGAKLVATAVASSRERVVSEIMHHVGQSIPRRLTEEESDFGRALVRMLARLEAGDESEKLFELSEEHVPPHLYATLTVAAAIPLGYVTTYGSIGELSGVIARTVGRIMATNPLYPIVPCHRVVGSDMSLVGYGGRQDVFALRSKLKRLRAEARGRRATEISVPGGLLPLYPVERVIAKSIGTAADPVGQLTLF